jgi:hypothetical protein
MAPHAFAKFVISVNMVNPTAGSFEVMVMSWIRVFSWCPSINGIFRPMPAFSLFAILDVEGLRLRVRNRCGLGLNRNLPFLDGH